MIYTQETFTHLFKTVRKKEELLAFVGKNPDCFLPLVQLSLLFTPEAWRASWLIGHSMHTNDERIQPYLNNKIDILLHSKEGHQRQTIIILLKMCLNESQEGKLFDHCLNIWENIKIIPSTRLTAMKLVLKTVEKFPELKNEVKLWTQEMYLEYLSSGIKNSFLHQS